MKGKITIKHVDHVTGKELQYDIWVRLGWRFWRGFRFQIPPITTATLWPDDTLIINHRASKADAPLKKSDDAIRQILREQLVECGLGIDIDAGNVFKTQNTHRNLGKSPDLVLAELVLDLVR